MSAHCDCNWGWGCETVAAGIEPGWGLWLGFRSTFSRKYTIGPHMHTSSLPPTWCTPVQDNGKWGVSFTMLAAIHVAANVRLALVTKTWTIYTLFCFLLSLLSYWIFSAVFCVLPRDFVTVMYWVNNMVCQAAGLQEVRVAMMAQLITCVELRCYGFMVNHSPIAMPMAEISTENAHACAEATATRRLPHGCWVGDRACTFTFEGMVVT